VTLASPLLQYHLFTTSAGMNLTSSAGSPDSTIIPNYCILFWELFARQGHSMAPPKTKNPPLSLSVYRICSHAKNHKTRLCVRNTRSQKYYHFGKISFFHAHFHLDIQLRKRSIALRRSSCSAKRRYMSTHFIHLTGPNHGIIRTAALGAGFLSSNITHVDEWRFRSLSNHNMCSLARAPSRQQYG